MAKKHDEDVEKEVKKRTKKKKGKGKIMTEEKDSNETSLEETTTSNITEKTIVETTTEEPTTDTKVEEETTPTVTEPEATIEETPIKTEVVETPVESPVKNEEPEVPVTPVINRRDMPSLEETPRQEPIVKPAITQEESVLCPYNRGINNYLIFALDVLNTCSVKDIDKIIRSRISIYDNIFSGIDCAATDEEAFQFITNLLDEINKRPYVTHKDRALVGFMRLSTLTKQQANLYQMVWKVLLDTSNPATRSMNAKMISWKSVTPFMSYHKKGENVNRRLYAYYQRM